MDTYRSGMHTLQRLYTSVHCAHCCEPSASTSITVTVTVTVTVGISQTTTSPSACLPSRSQPIRYGLTHAAASQACVHHCGDISISQHASLWHTCAGPLIAAVPQRLCHPLRVASQARACSADNLNCESGSAAKQMHNTLKVPAKHSFPCAANAWLWWIILATFLNERVVCKY